MLEKIISNMFFLTEMLGNIVWKYVEKFLKKLFGI